MNEPKCETGCTTFYGGEIRHDKNCAFYPDSRTEMYDKALTELTTLRSLVAAATQFELQAEHNVLPGPYKPQITAHRMRQFDGSIKWAVRKGSEVLNKKGKWEYEPIPSSRTDKFLERTRFDSLESAIEAFEALREGSDETSIA